MNRPLVTKTKYLGVTLDSLLLSSSPLRSKLSVSLASSTSKMQPK